MQSFGSSICHRRGCRAPNDSGLLEQQVSDPEQVQTTEPIQRKLIRYREIYRQLLRYNDDGGEAPQRFTCALQTTKKSIEAQVPKREASGETRQILELLQNEDLAERRSKQITTYLQSLMASK